MDHPEAKAITQSIELFEPLEDSQRAAVIAYLIQRFSLHGHLSGPAANHLPSRRKAKRAARARRAPVARQTIGSPKIDIAAIVNEFKGLDNFHKLQPILDKDDALNRVLLALALYRRLYKDTDGMTSGEIARFYKQLGITMQLPLISTTLSTRAKQFVMTDQERSKGVIMRYRLSRQGVKKVTELGISES